MTSQQTMVVIIVCFWSVWFLLCLVLKRSWIPVIPFVPLAALGLGYGLNGIHEWAGTVIVAIFHLVMIFFMGKMLLKAKQSH